MTPQVLAEYVKANYTKYEHRVPMRDGKLLFTSIYVPKDSSRSYPFLLSRTPYSCAPYGADRYRPNLGPNELFSRSGYIFVCQDVRGRYLSEGEFIEMTPHKAVKRGARDVDESSDTYDTIEWLLKNIGGNNGKAGIVGISYPGFYAAAAMIDAHPALKAASPQAPVVDLFLGDDAYHNGAFYLAANFGFYTSFGKKKSGPELPDPNARRFDFGSRDGYDFYKRLGPLANADEKYFKRESAYWTDLLAHTTYDDFWKSRNLARHVRNITPAVLTVGGWFDAEDLQGPLRLDAALEKQSPSTKHTLVMGPWVHGGWARGEGDKLGASPSIKRPHRGFARMSNSPSSSSISRTSQIPSSAAPLSLKLAAIAGANLTPGLPKAKRRISTSTLVANSASCRLPNRKLRMNISAIQPSPFPSSASQPSEWRNPTWWPTSALLLLAPTSSPTFPTSSPGI